MFINHKKLFMLKQSKNNHFCFSFLISVLSYTFTFLIINSYHSTSYSVESISPPRLVTTKNYTQPVPRPPNMIDNSTDPMRLRIAPPPKKTTLPFYPRPPIEETTSPPPPQFAPRSNYQTFNYPPSIPSNNRNVPPPPPNFAPHSRQAPIPNPPPQIASRPIDPIKADNPIPSYESTQTANNGISNPNATFNTSTNINPLPIVHQTESHIMRQINMPTQHERQTEASLACEDCEYFQNILPEARPITNARIAISEIQQITNMPEGKPTVRVNMPRVQQPAAPAPSSEITYINPVQPNRANLRTRISSPFGFRNTSLSNASANHKGIDIAINGTEGHPIVASRGGTIEKIVTNCNNRDSFCGGKLGNHVIIRHEDGQATLYAHLQNKSNCTLNINESTRVTQGQQIGCMGRTGVASGPHLHFEIFTGNHPNNKRNFDPELYVRMN